MADQIEIQIPKTRIQEGSGFTATAYFRIRSTSAADTPSAVRYRLDCLTTKTQIADWTSASAASSVAISVTATHNAIIDDCNDYEWKQLTVESDNGASNQMRKTVRWRVENLYGSP